MDAQGAQMIFALILAVFILIVLVLKTKIHAFVALLIAASVTGIVGGMAPSTVIETISEGFGSTLGTIGIVIGLGVMMGRVLEVSGAAERIAYTLIKWLGKKKEEWAMAVAGYFVSIPIFVDSAYVILMPIVKALSTKTGKSVVSLGVALGIGLTATHHMVPPTPGPLGVAGIYGIDVGMMMLWGLILGIPVLIAGVFYGKWIGNKIYQLPTEDGLDYVRPEKPINSLDEYYEMQEQKNLPGLLISTAPIFIPIILILMNTSIAATGAEGLAVEYITFLGDPVIAVAIGLIIAIYGLFHNVRQTDAIERMEEGIKNAGIILLVTGAGGALGSVLEESGTGELIGEQIAQTGLPAIMIPFLIATAVRLIQGSGTVAMITGASISAPIVATMDVNMVFAGLAATVGSMVFSYFNDSMFWVVNRMLGIKNVKEQLLVWSIPTTIAWGVALPLLLILNGLFG